MSVSVEHDKRKEEILDKALDVFVMEGYKDTTFQKIAERCGITRTILYLYFDNKKEIFSSCIKRFMGGLESEIRNIAEEDGKTSSEKLVAIGELVVRHCAEESKLLSIVLDYLLKLKMAGGDPGRTGAAEDGPHAPYPRHDHNGRQEKGRILPRQFGKGRKRALLCPYRSGRVQDHRARTEGRFETVGRVAAPCIQHEDILKPSLKAHWMD